KNIFDIIPEQCKKLKIQNPVISNEDLDKIKYIDHPDFKTTSVAMLYQIDKGLNGLEARLEAMVDEISAAIDKGSNIIILSDRNISKDMAPIPSALACSFVHHELSRRSKRSSIGIIIESAEPREPHHFALLFGYGASAINPDMVNELIAQLAEDGGITTTFQEAVLDDNRAIVKGIVMNM